MSKLRIRLKLNEGGVGAPLTQLVDVLTEAEKFFRYLADDVGINITKAQWLTRNYENSSLAFDTESGANLDAEAVKKFNHNFLEIAKLEKGARVPDGIIRHRTLVQYAKIGEKLQPHERLQLGLYRPEDETPFDWRPLSHRKATELADWFNESVSYIGTLQGFIHSVTIEGQKFVNIRPALFRTKLIRCDIDDKVYEKLHPLLSDGQRLVYFRGDITARRIDKEIVRFRAHDVKGAPPFSREKFLSMLGSDPDYTGDKTTEQAVDEGYDA